jgi:hypothetical protein
MDKAELLRKVSRAFSDRVADMCQVDREDHWKYHNEDVTADVQFVLDTASAPSVSVDEEPPSSRLAAWLTMNKPLHPLTVNLVVRFARALASKLSDAEKKYGYSDGWRSPHWMDECRAKMMHHVMKGDPRDVAAYCAFLWHHGASTASDLSANDHWRLPHEVQIGGARFGKGVKLSTVIAHANRLHKAAFGDPLSPEQQAENLKRLLHVANPGEAIAHVLATGESVTTDGDAFRYRDEPSTMINGLTEAETSATASVAGKVCRWVQPPQLGPDYEMLLRRAYKQIMRWAENYGSDPNANFLPPAGDVDLLEDISIALAAGGRFSRIIEKEQGKS